MTEPVGFNKVTCLGNSDTIVGVPLRMQGSVKSRLSANPTVNGNTATLNLVSSSLPTWTGSTRYVKFDSGTKDGSWYDITSNTADSLTINLNGDNLTGAVTSDSIVISEYWTLDTLFPPAAATTDPATTGHAIVASTGTSPIQRRTSILLPDIVTSGINLPASGIFTFKEVLGDE
ncbi:MAG: TIGR02597 family protein [Akkermansiaceae bacterium]|nr:TIGR02597 family protein [Akkermansiaceae bacterium]